jgi:hypothetical protein
MNESYEIPKVQEIMIYEAEFFHMVETQKWRPNFFVGPFLPITSSGEGNLPYKMIDTRGSTIVDYSQNFSLI